MTAGYSDNAYKSLGLWKWLIALGLALLLLLCWLGVFGKANMAVKSPTIVGPAALAWGGGNFNLNGIGEPGSKLGLYLNGTEVGKVDVGPDGKWASAIDLSTPGAANIEARVLDGAGQALAGQVSNPLNVTVGQPAAASAFTKPSNNEELDAQSYVLQGTGPADTVLELWQSTPGNPAKKIDTVDVGSDGNWATVITSDLPGTKPGTYTYELRKTGEDTVLDSRTVIIKAGLVKASNAVCPCSLRIFSNRKQAISQAKIELFKDGKSVGVGTTEKLFTGLSAGAYTYKVSAAGYQDFASGRATLPQNKNFEVYLKPVK